MLSSINPATGETIGEYPFQTEAEIQARLDAAESAFPEWSARSFSERAACFRELANVLRREADSLATIATREMGKPISQSRAEVEKCAATCGFYAQNAARFLAPEAVQTEASNSVVRFDPIGGVLAIMPWNFPYFQVIRFAAPAMMAGNVGILRHAGNVTGCALAIERAFATAGFPAGAFANVLVPHETVPRMMDHPIVRAVTLTGSEVAGRAVGKAAGERIKKTVLELGGSDAFIVLADADLEKTVAGAVAGRTINSGQSCIAAKRFLVEDAIAEAFEQRFAETMRSLIVGNPAEEATQVGPLARKDLVDKLHDQVARSVAAGAKILCGGEPADGRGCFYRPTVLTGVQPGMAAFEEETFGPVAAVTRVKNAEEAILRANQSSYGLGGSVWTNDIDRGCEIAARLDTGNVFVNEVTRSDARVPFGGVKLSGHGRELGQFGIREFVNIKTVWVG